MLIKERKQEITSQFRIKEGDTGSADVQVALLSERIRQLTEHLKVNPHDHSSRRGLFKLIGRRRRFLAYIGRVDAERYQSLISVLKLRK
jgi:small subunit ribosomal protein S15